MKTLPCLTILVVLLTPFSQRAIAQRPSSVGMTSRAPLAMPRVKSSAFESPARMHRAGSGAVTGAVIGFVVGFVGARVAVGHDKDSPGYSNVVSLGVGALGAFVGYLIGRAHDA